MALSPSTLTRTRCLLLLAALLLLSTPSSRAASSCDDTLLPVSKDLCNGLGLSSEPTDDACSLTKLLEAGVNGDIACKPELIKPVLTVATNGLTLPFAIPDLRPLPASFRRDTMLRTEASNYHYLYRIVWNLYLWVPCTVLPGRSSVPLPLPSGWTLLLTLNLTQPDLPPPAAALPLLAVMRKGRTLGVFIRGTQTTAEWNIDFQYQHANATSSATASPFPFPGKTHSGFTKMVNDLWAGGVQQLLDQQLALPLDSRPDTVIVTGHSLGGGVGTLLSYIIQDHINRMNILSPPRVDAYFFAPPNVGDKAFSRAFNKLVNARNIRFVFDIIPQVPCSPQMIACNGTVVDTTQGGTARTWSYQPIGGAISLTTQNIPVQRKVWDKLSSISTCNYDAFQDSTHVCSYMCALSYFTVESGDSCLLHRARASELDRGTYCHTDISVFPTRDNYP